MNYTHSIIANQYCEGQECPGVSFGMITVKFNCREKVEDGDYIIPNGEYFRAVKAELFEENYKQ